MVTSVGEVAENTGKSAHVAQEARESAAKGSRAVANTIDGMGRIRCQVQETAKRIKRLAESSQEIGEIVKLISDVADRTSILALNASIQAAMAGDAGQGFAVVAEEVERLANRCNDATKQIARLVRCIQTETSGAMIEMEESIREVVEGSALATQAGEALADIDSVSNRLSELITSISCAAKQQARGGLLVSRTIDEVSSVMQETADGAKKTVKSVNHLTDLADDLRLSVSRLSGLEIMAPSLSDAVTAHNVDGPSCRCSMPEVATRDSVTPGP
jgi:methyl-accepting chemotaxis protein